MKLIWKILREHLSISQLTSFLLATIVGITIILLGLQLYADINPILQSNTDFLKPEFMVISKPVTTLDTFSGSKPTFSKSEQKDIESQPFVDRMGLFRAAQYEIYGRINLGSYDLSSEMFFESVPDIFVDVTSDRWHYSPGDEVVPIVIPRDYLSLYNFGYAQSNSMMPAISEQLISSISIRLNLYGHGQRRSLTGEVVGLSNRLNTILVPESFIEWSNGELANDTTEWEPARIILQLNNPTDKRVADYIHEKDYVVANDKLDASKATWFLRILVTIVLVIGLIICALACYILILSIFLLLQKNTQQMRDLRLLGYSHRQLARPYMWIIVSVNILAFAIAFMLLWIVRGVYLPYLETLATDYIPAPMTYSWMLTGSLILTIIIFNILIIYRRVRHL